MAPTVDRICLRDDRTRVLIGLNRMADVFSGSDESIRAAVVRQIGSSVTQFGGKALHDMISLSSHCCGFVHYSSGVCSSGPGVLPDQIGTVYKVGRQRALLIAICFYERVLLLHVA